MRWGPAAAPGVVVVAGQGGGHVLPLIPREDDERFVSQQVKALLAGMLRAAFLGAPRVADQNERGLQVTLYLAASSVRR